MADKRGKGVKRKKEERISNSNERPTKTTRIVGEDEVQVQDEIPGQGQGHPVASSCSISLGTSRVSMDFEGETGHALKESFVESIRQCPTDLELICSDGGVAPVHRFVLMGVSKFFFQLLRDRDMKDTEAVTLVDVSIHHLSLALELIYSGFTMVKESDEGGLHEVLNLFEINIKLERKEATEQELAIRDTLQLAEDDDEDEDDDDGVNDNDGVNDDDGVDEDDERHTGDRSSQEGDHCDEDESELSDGNTNTGEVRGHGYGASSANIDSESDGSDSDTSESELDDDDESLPKIRKSHLLSRDTKVFNPSSPMTDIIVHAFLPNVTPDSEQKNLDTVENSLLEMALASISNVMDEIEISELELVKDMFEKWTELQSEGDTSSSSAAFTCQFPKMAADLKEGDTIPLYVKMQNATILITKLSDGNMRIATFRTSLPSKVIMSNVSSLSMTFPETCEVIQNTDLLASSNFVVQLFDLTTKARKSREIPVRDVAEPFLVSDWIVGCLAPVEPSQSPVVCQKKIRDQVNLKIHQSVDAQSKPISAEIPFRRSGMWLSIKVALQLKLLEIFGEDHKEKANSLYKIIILRILTDICVNYLITTPMNLDLASQMAKKLGRRVLKLTKVATGNNEDANPEIRLWKELSMDHTLCIMKQVTSAVKSQWKKMICSCDSNKEGSCYRNSARVIHHCEEALLRDLIHQVPWLDMELENFLKNPGYGNVVTTDDHNTNLRKQPEIERYSTKKSILDSYEQISCSSTPTTGQVDNYLKTRVWLHDTEHLVKTRLHLEVKNSSTLFRLAQTYFKIARNFYHDNPVENSQMYLVILRIHQELDKLATRIHPLLLKYKSGVTRKTFEKLVLPHKKDIQLLDEIFEYFKARDERASQSDDVLASFEVKHETFAAAFARQNQEMIGLKQTILQDTEKAMEEKYEEVRKTKERCQELQRKINLTSCECRYENVRDWRWKNNEKEYYYYKKKGRRTHFCENCTFKSDLRKARKSVDIYERPLPLDEPWVADAIVFELRIPRRISKWRENLAMLKYELMGETPGNTDTPLAVKTLVSDYSNISRYQNISPGDVVSLGSKCHPTFSTIRNKNPDVINSVMEDFVIDNGLQCFYHYQRRRRWPETVESVQKVCAFRLSHTCDSSPYLGLQTNLESTGHTQNQVIARKIECHRNLSMDEFIAFGSLRAGHRIQLRNLYRSISGRILSLDEEPVLALIMQALWQNEQSDTHLDFQDDDFCLEFLEMLEKLVKENELNYSKPLVLLNAIVITTRIMELNESVTCQSKCYNVLKAWRHEVIDQWVVKIEANMKKPSVVDASLRESLFQVRLCSAFSFNVILSMTDNVSNMRNVMRNHDDVLHWLHTIHDLNGFTDISTVSKFSRILFQVAMRNSLKFQLSKVISAGKTTMPYVKEALHSFAKQKWSGARVFTRGEITLLNSASSNNVIQMPYTGPTGNSYMVTFDLIVGTFFVNGYSQSQLPPEVAADPLFQRFFNESTKLMVERDSNCETRTSVEFHGKHYQFTSGHLSHSQDSVILVKEIQEDSSIWIMLDFKKFKGFVPEYLVDNYSHWLDPTNGEVHFRRLPKTSADYKRPPDFTLKNTDLWKLLDTSSGNPLLNFTSSGFNKVCDALLPFESAKYIDAQVDIKDANNLSVTARLRRHNLNFKLKLDSELLESVEYPGFYLSSDQTSKSRGTLIGLRNGVILENQQTNKRFFITPHGDIMIVPGRTQRHHQNVSINLTTLRQPSFFLYEYDDVLKRVKAVSKSKSAWLYLAALHGATSSSLPDRFILLTGTEMAMSILQAAFVWNCSPYDKESLKTLEFIRGLAPKRVYYATEEMGESSTANSSESMAESTEWPKAIPSMAAYDGLAMVVEKLLEDSGKLERLFGTSTTSAGTDAKNFLQVRGYLRSQRFHNSAAYLQPAYRSDFLEKIIKNNNDSQKIIQHPEIPKLRSTSKPKISLCSLLQISAARLNLNRIPQSMQISTNVRKFILQSESNLHAAYPLLVGSEELCCSLDTLFAWDLRSNWLRLYVWASSRKTREEELNFTLLLSAMAYRNAPLEQINTLHCISTVAKIAGSNKIFPDVPSRNQSYTGPLQIHYSVSQVQDILERHGKKFDKSYESFGNDFKKYEKARKAYKAKISSDCSIIAKHLKSKWPCDKLRDGVTHELENLAGLNFQLSHCLNDQSRNEINQTLQNWFENLKLYNFLAEVEAKLGAFLKNDKTFRKRINTPNLAECETVVTLSEYLEPAEVKADDILRRYGLVNREITDEGRVDNDGYFISQRHKILAKLRQHIKLITNPEAATPQVKIGLMVGIGPRLDPVSLLKSLTCSAEVTETVKSYARTLGVLCSKLNRINRCIAMRSSPGFFNDSPEYQREIQNPGYLNWSPVDHPEWLLLELELDIMIRPIQIEAAQRMISMPENNGNGVMQLNMGEGKTSVIVPMLCATLASATDGSLCRVTVLSSMFNMNLGILSFAIGGLLDRRVYTIPCRRDMNIDSDCVDAIQNAYKESLKMKGVVLTLPEYRLSFRLLAYDKMFKNDFTLGLKLHRVENWLRRHARDILDESDELLGVKYQLVYTVGVQVPIDGGDIRWTVCQKLLHIVQKVAPQLLQKYGLNMIEFDDSKCSTHPHTFTSVRLLHHKIDSNASQDVENFLRDFMTSVADESLNEFMLTDAQKRTTMEFLVQAEVSKEVHASVLEIFEAVPAQLEKVFIMSGYLRRGFLALALGKRWRVEYGVNPKDPRLMAVPFRAKDVAAEKTKFGHPDLAIILTHLSYYYSGLDEAQLVEAFGILRGKRNPDTTYDSWISSIPETQVDPSLKNYRNLNFMDVNQRSKLFDLLSHHKTVIDYWLSHKVFPKESNQFPGKLVMTSWDLCHERNRFPVCGFSGTNDSQILLPLQITQQDLPQLLDTNAKMEETLLRPENGGHREFPIGVSCRQILEQMKEDKLAVLIDAGALMLECNNEQVADLWLEVNPDLEAVVYFSKDNELLVKTRSTVDCGTNKSRGNWISSKVCDTQKDTAFDLSPYQGRLEKCGVFLDDQHTRGTDLKFPIGSRACVTIGSRMKRDKLIQACMRMRKLGSGHSVTFYLAHEVANKIYGSTEYEIETKGVLDWVTANTREFNQDGLFYWAIAGKHYAQRLAAEDNFRLSTSESKTIASQCVDDEVIKLCNMYGQFTELEYLWKLVPQWFQTAKEKLTMKNEETPLAPEVIQKFDSIGECIKSKIFDHVPSMKHFFTSDGAMMEEGQEQELEQETEMEEERQAERQQTINPAVHQLHPNVINAIQGKPSTGFRVAEGIHRLPDIFKDTTFWKEVQPNGWNGDVFATKDFIEVVICRDFSSRFKSDPFLRPLEFLASTFNSRTGRSQLLLLSPFEVNEMIPWFRSGQTKCRLHLFSTRRAVNQNILLNKARLQLPRMTSDTQGLSFVEPDTSPSITALLLASGSLYFRSMEEQKCFARFLSLAPQPWTNSEKKLFERGMITSTTFLLPRGRSGKAKSATKSFSRDPTGLVSRVLQCRHPIVSEMCHVGRLLDDKSYVEIVNTSDN